MNEPQKDKPHGAGRSSFELIDPDKVFKELALEKGATFLDMASGPGHYAMAAAKIVGEEGLVYAIDLWEEGITSLREQAVAQGVKNIQTVLGDISKPTPVESQSVDVCLMATVLHELDLADNANKTIEEVARVTAPHGSLAVIEFKKIPGPPGPPLHIRLAPEDVAAIVSPHGFDETGVTDVGPYNYLIAFSRGEAR